MNGFSAPPPQPENSGMATTSMILGIISFLGVPLCGITALITGIIAKHKINSSNGLLLGNGKAITGIIFGCFSIIRIFIAFALILPALVKAREHAREISCVSNLKQIGLGIMMYASDNHEYLPKSLEDIQEYIGRDDRVMKCPNAKDSEDGTYTLLPLEKRKMYEIKYLSETPTIVCTRHKRFDIEAYADGHVQTNPKQTIPNGE